MKISLIQLALAMIFSSMTFAHEIHGQDLLDRTEAPKAEESTALAVQTIVAHIVTGTVT